MKARIEREGCSWIFNFRMIIMKFYSSLICLLILCLSFSLLSSCRQENRPDEAEKVTGKLFKVHGIVQEIKLDENKVIIDHAEIPDYMGAMIMPFKVKEAAELIGLEAGDEIRFDYWVQELQSWIENVKVTGNKGEVKIQAAGKRGRVAGEVLPINSQLPDYSFFDESGNLVKLSDYRAGPHVLTFVFTRCPVPEYCPALMRNFSRVNDLLKDDPKAPDSWSLLTISFDVDFDTPEVMERWGRAFGFEPGQSWHLLSAKKGSDTIQKITVDVGLKFGENKGSYQHNLRTVVLDAEGRIRHVFTDESWSVEELIEELKKAEHPLN